MIKGFHIEYRADHVHVQLESDFVLGPTVPEQFWNELRGMCEEHSSRRVLVEGFVPAGERDTAQVIAAGERTAAVPHLWMAFHLENFAPNEASELFEVIAGSKGVRVKFFADTEHALMWLRNNSPG